MSERIYKVTLEKCKELETETGKFLIWKLPGSHWMIIRTIKLNKSKKKNEHYCVFMVQAIQKMYKIIKAVSKVAFKSFTTVFFSKKLEQ